MPLKCLKLDIPQISSDKNEMTIEISAIAKKTQ